MNMITEEQVAQALAEQHGMQVVAVSDLTIPPEVPRHLTEPMANLYRVIPLASNDV